jgi:hypothetical protein
MTSAMRDSQPTKRIDGRAKWMSLWLAEFTGTPDGQNARLFTTIVGRLSGARRNRTDDLLNALKRSHQGLLPNAGFYRTR